MKKYPESGIKIRNSSDLLPGIFKTEQNEKFLKSTVDAITQPGVLKKIAGYVGKRYGRTFTGSDVYLENDETLRSRYQLEPGVISQENGEVKDFSDYLDFKNILSYFENQNEDDKQTVDAKHYSWNPPIDWDKFINYREYYWIPEGPPAVNVAGNRQDIISNYKVQTGNVSSWIFFPDGLTPNPTITLYRGQTYNFEVNAINNPFTIRTNYDSTSILFNSNQAYTIGEFAVFAGNIYRAKVAVSPGQGAFDVDQWDLLDENETPVAFDYAEGIVNNGISNGTITFNVPLDAPDRLFYQSATEPDRIGVFVIKDIEENTVIDVDKEVLGKSYYTSSNNIEFTNGLAVKFTGIVHPAEYNDEKFIIEGVGDSIRLVKFDDLVIPPIASTETTDVIFDNAGFDTQPFDEAGRYPFNKDYITSNRSSKDRNAWSRYNRWFHKSVLEYAFLQNNSSFSANEDLRAKRPIIEYKSDLQLFNHGAVAKDTVDLLDDFTTDVFSTIEGSIGYNIDNVDLYDGARILFTADTDNLVKNKIYTVSFISHNGQRLLHLTETEDTDPVENESVIIRYGSINSGKVLHFDNNEWKVSQEKIQVNQKIFFELFDDTGVKFSDQSSYTTSTFEGTPIIEYKQGVGANDSELGFPIAYLNINNTGDIQFTNDLDNSTFSYIDNQVVVEIPLSSGFYKFNNEREYENSWTLSNNTYHSPIVDSITLLDDTDTVEFNTVNFSTVSDEDIFVYVDGERYTEFQRENEVFKFDDMLSKNAVISAKIFGDTVPVDGYYEIPVGLEKNPLNENLIDFTLGMAIDHVVSALEFDRTIDIPSDKNINLVVGNNNLRDLDGFINNSTRFMKHQGLNPLSLYLLTNKKYNLVKSIEYCKQEYSTFKNRFISNTENISQQLSPANAVDEIMNSMTDHKQSQLQFKTSDMIGFGAYTTIDLTVQDVGIKTFALNNSFDLTNQSYKAVYIYVNGQQLFNNADYEFDYTFGYVTLKIDLNVGDEIEIREYVSTLGSFIPATPTKLGLYKKYKPEIFIDNTFVEPKKMIQGHDGSLFAAFDDYRDDIILELEKRIYNNIKESYNEDFLDIDNLMSSYYETGIFNKGQVDDVLAKQFLNWIQDSTLDYTNNIYLDTENSFTYTYSNMIDPSETVNLPGYWRGVYRWFYGTDRPHTRPWEMLGFTEKPSWWEEQYGPAPYTRNNLVLWEDLQNGVIQQGIRAGTYKKYSRPGLVNYIPTDEQGNLISPLNSGLAKNFVFVNNTGDFKFGDVSPIESAWRYSSDYPYSILIALSLLKPFAVISENLDRVGFTKNILNQTVSSSSLTFKNLDQINLADNTVQTSGMINFVNDYALANYNSNSDLLDTLQNLDVKLSHRASGFLDQEKLNVILDSKSPRSASDSVFLPAENFQVYYNTSAPITSFSYSGVIFEKTETGFKINGYNRSAPYFNYYEPLVSKGDPIFNVGGVSESFVNWTEDKFYANGTIAQFNNVFYRARSSHTSTANFDTNLWTQLPKLPVEGGVDAFKRRSFTQKIARVPYGKVFNSIQEIVDFLLGYQKYLESVGFLFDEYDAELKENKDFFTASKELMFWSSHNWANGSLITLSPLATNLTINFPVGVAENLFDPFLKYSVSKSDGTIIESKDIDVNRSFQTFNLKSRLETDGIYFLSVAYVLKEHVLVFDEKSIFNDIIYQKNTGYRQQRIKLRGYKTSDWDGDYTTPGFIYDDVNIQEWQSFTDYRLGDIVRYRDTLYTSILNQPGVAEFNENNWTVLDLIPKKELIPNFEYKIDQFKDYFNLDSDAVSGDAQDLARHTFGYQQRNYLNNLIEDEVSQFKIYQGFIREKGSSNSISKVFDKLSRANDSNLQIKEEWAFNTSIFGGKDAVKEIEFKVPVEDFAIEPQPIIIESTDNLPDQNDQIVRIIPDQFTKADFPFSKNIFDTSLYNNYSLDAGYVNTKDVRFIVKDVDELLTLNINDFTENDIVWITFYNQTWNVLRFSRSKFLLVEDIIEIDDTVEIVFNRSHSFETDDIIGFKQIPGLNGFHRVISTGFRSIFVVKTSSDEISFDYSTTTRIYQFSTARYKTYDNLPFESVALLENNSLIWLDKNTNEKWEVLQKNKIYDEKTLVNYGISVPSHTGYRVLYLENLKQSIASVPGSDLVLALTESVSGLTNKQLLGPPSAWNFINGSVGEALAASPDERYLAIGIPLASDVPSKYTGKYLPSLGYQAGDIVLHDGKLWEARVGIVPGDGSTINIYTQDWRPAENVSVNLTASQSGLENQGLVLVYKRENNQWNIQSSFVSPRPERGEKFGSSIAISLNGSTYEMTVGAPGSLSNRGRLYTYTLEGNDWKINQNPNYKGLYSNAPESFYPSGSIVYFDNNLWQANNDVYGDGSTLSIDSVNWNLIDPISTHCSLPTNVSLPYDVDDSTLLDSTTQIGVLTDDQTAELTKQGDEFGKTIASSATGNILVVGAPFSDEKFFENYKGRWEPWIEYREDDVVRFEDNYFKLTDPDSSDSTITSINETPESLPWINVGDSSRVFKGKVFVYQKENGFYNLIQTISSENFDNGPFYIYGTSATGSTEGIRGYFYPLYTDRNLADSLDDGAIPTLGNGSSHVHTFDEYPGIEFYMPNNSMNHGRSDAPTTLRNYDTKEELNLGDLFGSEIDVDASGSTIVVSSPLSDIDKQDQGAVFIFKTENLENPIYSLKQKIISFNDFTSEYFGSAVSISKNNERIAVGAKNSKFLQPTSFDLANGTEFDAGTTRFFKDLGFTGQVFVFERKGDFYYLAESLESDLQDEESFGFSIDCTATNILVGSPDFEVSSNKFGTVRLFSNNSQNSIATYRLQSPQVDIEKIKNIKLYDRENSIQLADVETIDNFKLKFLSLVEQEISFKTPYDPAIYTTGIDQTNVDENQAWFEKNVGKLWWDLSTAKWLNYEQDDFAYRVNNWNSQAYGSSVDVYEWVETTLLPSEWSLVADTTEGLQNGISGTPLYSDDTVYSVKVLFDINSGNMSETLYYYWVKNKKTVPVDTNRNISASTVVQYINDPKSAGIPYIAPVDKDKFVAYNVYSNITNENTFLNILREEDKSIPIHKEYQLLTEDDIFASLNTDLEQKWIDSLIGYDQDSNRVPDPALPEREKYGIDFRPRQSMFINNYNALEILVKRINLILNSQPFVDTINFTDFLEKDEIPNAERNLYDLRLSTLDELDIVESIRLRTATLTANIVDGKIDTVDIENTGAGYRTPPTLEIIGDGTGAEISLEINSIGQVSNVRIDNPGKNYTSVQLLVRPYSILVETDESNNNFWAVYAFDDERRTFYKSLTQNYDVSLYWNYSDWWKPGYGIDSRIVNEIENFSAIPNLTLQEGDLIRIKNYGSGGWTVLEKTNLDSGDISTDFTIVGREDGTIQLDETLYNTSSSQLGYDIIGNFDTNNYDNQPYIETRKLIYAVKNNILTNEFANEWNKLFFASVKYALTEQKYLPWVFKTSFINVKHTVGDLDQPVNFRQNNTEYFQDYINEVKPYRSTIREYVSAYNSVDGTSTAMTDFDPTPYYDQTLQKIVSPKVNNNIYNTYPWKYTADNIGYSIVNIEISSAGSGYTTAPRVIITGTGTDASAKAFIRNGAVRQIQIINQGSGYIGDTAVSLVGGNGSNPDKAKAIAILGNSKIRTFDTKIKFDRVSKYPNFSNFGYSENFVATGNSAVFELAYPPTINRDEILVFKNDQTVFSTDYNLTLYYQTTNGYTQLKGKITFLSPPEQGDSIRVNYDINDDLLDAVSRINKHYSPMTGMKGKDTTQLMTGVDFGGVQIQGNTFDVTGGWDALPWFTDGWDSVESSGDFYVVADGSTNTVVLPYTPASGEIITVYLKRADLDYGQTVDNLQYSPMRENNKEIRVDDLYFDLYDGITVQPNGRTEAPGNALMPSFIGDGSTRVVEIGDYIRTYENDILVFRKLESDGTVQIDDNNIVDTNLSGGDLSFANGAYATANGLTAEQIVVNGGQFIDPANSSGPEENIPGQVLESLSLKVYSKILDGATPIVYKVYVVSGQTAFDIGQEIFDYNAIFVYVDGVEIDSDEYIVNKINNTIQFNSQPLVGSKIEILSAGLGGSGILDYQTFVSDGETNQFLTRAQISDTNAVVAFVDGVKVDSSFENSAEATDVLNKTLVRLAFAPTQDSVVKIICLRSEEQDLIRVNEQEFVFEGSTRSFDIDNFVYDQTIDPSSSISVSVNDVELIGVDTILETYNGTNNVIELGVDPIELIGSITSGNIQVYINDRLLEFVLEYTFDGNTNTIDIRSELLTVGDTIKIITDVRAEYEITTTTDSSTNGILSIKDAVSLNTDDVIKIIFFGNYTSMDIISDQLSGGQSRYKLERTPLGVDYLWVYVNGVRQRQDIDYYLNVDDESIYFKNIVSEESTVKIIQYSSNIYNNPSIYEISKDMLNSYQYTRISVDNEVRLTSDLKYYDEFIEVSNTDNLFEPDPQRNVPGTILIGNEKIDYFVKDGNKLSQLRRGVRGTSINEIYETGTNIIDVSVSERVPYTEDIIKTDFVSDGSTLMIGPLSYVPKKTEITDWYRETDSIPDDFGQCDEVEVFVAGTRMNKNPAEIYDNSLGDIGTANSLVKVEAEYSCDGETPFIRLTEVPAVGTRIHIIKKTGRTWYDQGENSASSGTTLLKNNTDVANFLKLKYSDTPE